MHAIPLGLKPLWDKDFLALLYDTITQKTEDDFGSEVFNRVERTFCCGLQSADPAVRKKVRSGVWAHITQVLVFWNPSGLVPS